MCLLLIVVGIVASSHSNKQQRGERSHGTSGCTCRALWPVSMPCCLRHARPRVSGELPTFQSDVAPLSMTHCNNRKQKRGANYCYGRCEGGWSYLPGHMPHEHVMPLHAGLTTVVWRVSYLIGGCGSTVYPPLGRAEHGEQ